MSVPSWLWSEERSVAEQRTWEAAEFCRITGAPPCRRHWTKACSDTDCRGDHMDPALERYIIRAASDHRLTPAEIDRVLTRTSEMPPAMESARRPHKWRIAK